VNGSRAKRRQTDDLAKRAHPLLQEDHQRDRLPPSLFIKKRHRMRILFFSRTEEVTVCLWANSKQNQRRQAAVRGEALQLEVYLPCACVCFLICTAFVPPLDCVDFCLMSFHTLLFLISVLEQTAQKEKHPFSFVFSLVGGGMTREQQHEGKSVDHQTIDQNI